MPQGPRYERSPDQLDWVDEAQHYEDWLQEEAERDAMAAIEAEKGFAPEQASEPEVGEKRKAAEIAPSFTPNDDVFNEYVCPITQELPREPCMAEDGHCYDRWAFKKWAQRQKEGELKSPMTSPVNASGTNTSTSMIGSNKNGPALDRASRLAMDALTV